MDIDVARWILEYLLRQSLSDRTLDALLRVLPIPNDNPSLKKSMLLRRIETEIANGNVSEKLLRALEAVRAYVDEAWKSMGPSFLEVVAGTVVDDDTMREIFGWGDSQIGDRVDGDSTQDLVVSDKDKESQRGGVLPGRKHAAIKRSRGAATGTSRGVKITDIEEPDLRKLSKNYKCLPTPETNEVQEALRTSFFGATSSGGTVEDPLPDALRLAENTLPPMESVQGYNGKEPQKS